LTYKLLNYFIYSEVVTWPGTLKILRRYTARK